jgi:ABC-type nickel/cobalt efflux system permease component RcnA
MPRTLLSLIACLALAPAAGAHPIPKNNHDRTVVVRLTPRAVVVEYGLEVDELTALNDMPRSEWARSKDRHEFYVVFLRYFAPILGDNVVVSLDGHPLRLTCVSHQFKVLDHLRCDYRFEAPWKLGPGREYAVSVREGNYELDSVSRMMLSVNAESGVRLLRRTTPDAALQAKPAEDRGPGDDERLRCASATFQLESTSTPAPPMPRAVAPTEPETVVESPGSRASGSADSTTELIRLLHESNHTAIALVLLLAAGIGAAHALTPGHGKTLVAAYLVGERGTVWHAVLLGLVTTLTHTGAVLVLAIVLTFWFGNTVPPGVERTIGLVGGFMVTGLGLWLLTRRLSGRADHFHFGAGHGHGHGHGHGPGEHSHGHGHADHSHAGPRVGLGPLVWLGMAGGIIPCLDAIVVLLAALGKGLVWLGPALILAFSAGLAAVLVGIGVAVVFARRHIEARSVRSEWLHRVVATLPLLSAVAVTALGLWMCYDSARVLK